MRGYFYTGPDEAIRSFEEYVHEELGDPTFRMPTTKIVCPRCRGFGVHDCWEGGMTSEEMFEQGEEFIEDYLNGHYDTVCEECKGKNVIDEVDEDALSPEMLAEWRSYWREIDSMNQESAMEMRMGA